MNWLNKKYDNFFIGNCYNKDFHQSPISSLRIDDYNCSVCDLNPCGNSETCVITDQVSDSYECRQTSRRSPMNFPPQLSASTSVAEDSRLSLNFRLVLWISVSVCVAVLGLLCTLVIWLYYHKKRRRKFKIPTDDELPYKEIVVTKASSRSSVYLTMLSPTKVKDTDVLLSSPWFEIWEFYKINTLSVKKNSRSKK